LVGLVCNTVAWHKPHAEDCVVWSSHPQPGVVLHRALWCVVVMCCGVCTGVSEKQTQAKWPEIK